jgi:hypothetical protein
MIQMPDKDNPKYKKALVRVFLLTLFELNYNYDSSYSAFDNVITQDHIIFL